MLILEGCMNSGCADWRGSLTCAARSAVSRRALPAPQEGSRMKGTALVTKALRIAAVVALVLLSTSAARADAIPYRFSGVGHAKPTEAQSWGFDPIPDDVPIPFSGTFSYDPKLPALGG